MSFNWSTVKSVILSSASVSSAGISSSSSPASSSSASSIFSFSSSSSLASFNESSSSNSAKIADKSKSSSRSSSFTSPFPGIPCSALPYPDSCSSSEVSLGILKSTSSISSSSRSISCNFAEIIDCNFGPRASSRAAFAFTNAASRTCLASAIASLNKSLFVLMLFSP